MGGACFFLRGRQETRELYKNLFEGGTGEPDPLALHWGWQAVLFELAEGDPIRIDYLADMNAIAFLNHWAINVDKGKIEKEKMDKIKKGLK